MGIALAATVMAAVPFAVALPATPAFAVASFTNCNGENFDTCAHVQGTGLYVDYISGWTTNDYPVGSGEAIGLHIEITGPSGSLKSCATFNLNAGHQSPTCTWTKNGNVNAGNHCAILWGANGSGGYNNLGTACVNIHS